MIHIKKSICSETTGCDQIASITKMEHYLPHPSMSKTDQSSLTPLWAFLSLPTAANSLAQVIKSRKDTSLIYRSLKLKLFSTYEIRESFKVAEICISHFCTTTKPKLTLFTKMPHPGRLKSIVVFILTNHMNDYSGFPIESVGKNGLWRPYLIRHQNITSEHFIKNVNS